MLGTTRQPGVRGREASREVAAEGEEEHTSAVPALGQGGARPAFTGSSSRAQRAFATPLSVQQGKNSDSGRQGDKGSQVQPNLSFCLRLHTENNLRPDEEYSSVILFFEISLKIFILEITRLLDQLALIV